MYSYIPPANPNLFHLNSTQFYFLDTALALQERLRPYEQFQPSERILGMINDMLEEINPYMAAFQCYRENIELAAQNGTDAFVYLVNREPAQANLQGNYQVNRFAPNAVNGEVAAVFTDIDGQLGGQLYVIKIIQI